MQVLTYLPTYNFLYFGLLYEYTHPSTYIETFRNIVSQKSFKDLSNLDHCMQSTTDIRPSTPNSNKPNQKHTVSLRDKSNSENKPTNVQTVSVYRHFVDGHAQEFSNLSRAANVKQVSILHLLLQYCNTLMHYTRGTNLRR